MKRIGSRCAVWFGLKSPSKRTLRGKLRPQLECFESRQLMSVTPWEASALEEPAEYSATASLADYESTPVEFESESLVSASPVYLSDGLPTPQTELVAQELVSSGKALGNFVMLPTRGNIVVPSTALSDPDIAGFVVRDTWSNVNPAPGVYNWSRIDAAISKITAAGKSFKLAIYTGVETPDWVYDRGAQSMRFYESGGNRPTGWYTMPVPWDSTMLQSYSELLRAMSSKYSTNPALAMVELGGPTRFSLEMHVPQEVTSQPGYSPAAITNAWSTVLNAYRGVFPNTYGSIALGNPVSSNDGIAQQVAANAVSILGPRAALQHNAMSAKSGIPTYNIHQIVSYYGSRGVMAGYEQVSSSRETRFGGSFATSWECVLSGNGRFYDIYVPDDTLARPFPGSVLNQPPSFNKGPNVNTIEDAGTYVYSNWATGISPGSSSETNQVLSFEVTGNSNPKLFSVAPSIDSAGNLRFTTAPHVYGTANLTVVLRDNGGTSGGGVNVSESKTFSISLASMNDAPVLNTTGLPVLNSINMNPGSNAGTMVSSLLSTAAGGNPISDVDVGARRGIAVLAADTSNGQWQYTINGGNSWLPMGPVTSYQARLLLPDSSTKVRFVPNTNFIGTSFIHFRAWDTTTGFNGAMADTTGAGGTSPFSWSVESATIAVVSVLRSSLAVETPVVDVQLGSDTTVDVPDVDLSVDVLPQRPVTIADDTIAEDDVQSELQPVGISRRQAAIDRILANWDGVDERVLQRVGPRRLERILEWLGEQIS